MDEVYKVGQRVQDLVDYNSRGTICYVGGVDGTSGVWLGIDWDNLTRGKHDGSHNGKRYFSSSSSNSGSFVRPTKVTCGQSLQDAVIERYGASCEVDVSETDSLAKEINAPFVQMVGFEKVSSKQSDFAKLKTVAVRGSRVNGTDDLESLSSFLASVMTLDLAENLVNQWDVVANMCRQLQRLKVLNVSENRLEASRDEALMKEAFTTLQQLVMGKMNYDWNDILKVIHNMSELKVLHAYHNRVSAIRKPLEEAKKLVEVNLNGNPIGWADVMQLSTLPSLSMLSVNECNIEQIRVGGEKTAYFANLRSLQIVKNKVKDWQSISALGQLPVLADIKCRDNPVMDAESPSTCRQIVIASIANAKIVNGTEVEKVERFGAEVDYLKRHGRQYLDSLNDPEKLAVLRQQFPRYESLVHRFGAPEESELRVIDTSLKASLLKVNIICPDDNEQKPLTKSLPPAMVVSKLRSLLQRMIRGSKGHELKLSYASANSPNFEVPFDNDMRDLFFYDIMSGDTIFVRW